MTADGAPRMTTVSRRAYLATAASVGIHSCIAPRSLAASPNDRPRLGVVGCGSRWGWQLANGGKYGVGPDFSRFGDYVAACDVDRKRVEAGAELIRGWNGSRPTTSVDYRDILARDDVDVVVIFTPDHWHAKIAIEAMRAGKDVYCEKPLTLTIDEGKRICDAAEQTGRILQVGTQQRSDLNFLTAIAMIRDGRIGKIRRVTCGVGGAPTSPSIPVTKPPKSLDWDRWLGPVPELPFRFLPGAENETSAWSNSHYEFRWWYEFSGGKLTDWGAHHVDIASWAIDRATDATLTVTPNLVEHPVEFKDGMPVAGDRYNTATKFDITVTDPSGVELAIVSHARNGIMFEGEQGNLFVNRGTLAGQAVDELKSKPLPDGAVAAVYKNHDLPEPTPGFDSLAHVHNFFECIASREEPISDVRSHHRALTTCHLAGIAARLNSEIRWDGKQQTIVDDPVAAKFISREKRAGYEIS